MLNLRRIWIGIAAVGLLAVGAVSGAALTGSAGAGSTASAGAGVSNGSMPPIPKYRSLARKVGPIGAPGRALALSRVVIQPGAKIPLHFHEGTQISSIQAGTLTYTVKTGGVRVMTGPGDAGTLVRKIRAGQTGRVKAGEWMVEQPGTHHRAANRGNSKIVIYLSTLLKKNAGPSTLLP